MSFQFNLLRIEHGHPPGCYTLSIMNLECVTFSRALFHIGVVPGSSMYLELFWIRILPR